MSAEQPRDGERVGLVIHTLCPLASYANAVLVLLAAALGALPPAANDRAKRAAALLCGCLRQA